MKLSPFLPSKILFLAILIGLMTPMVCFGADPTSGPSTTIVISQVYGGGGNSGAILKNDFIELYNLGSSPVSLAGWSVQYASQNGSSWIVTPLTGTIQPGHYYLVQEAPGAGGAQNLPTPDASGSIAMSGNSAKVALVTTTTALSGTCPSSASIIDFVGYGPANCFEGTAGTASLSNTTAGLRKGEGCVDTNSNTADFKVGSPNPRNSSNTYDCSNYTPPAEVSIHAIQGSGPRSPYADKDVITTGIVTARKYNGFFIQEADPGDSDPATSDGVFVFTSSNPPTSAAVGNLVQVAGVVQEYAPSGDLYSPPMTEIISPTVTVVGTGDSLPAVISIAPDPNGAADQLERYEGMRVSIAAMTVVGPTEGSVNEKTAVATSNGIFYGVLDGVARPFREAGVSVFETLPTGSPCCVPRFDENPERIRVDSDAILGQAKLEVTPGAKLTGIVGPLDFGDRTYTIDPEAAPTVVADGILSARAVPMPNGDEFTVAAYNMERFLDSTELSGVTAAALAGRVNKAALAIVNVLNLPDILAVEEMGNINSLQKIADQVNVVAAANGKEVPNYTPYLVEGNDVGGIDVGFLVKSTRVTVNSVEQVGKDTPFVWGTSTELLNDRPPLVLKGVVGTSPMSMPATVIVNHLRSLNDIDAADGRVRAKRAAQAEFLANLIQGMQSANPLENIVSVGDYNAFEVNDGYVDVMGTIRGNPVDSDHVVLATEDLVNPDLTDLVDTLPADERYSYSFGGNAQVLDHVLVNPPIAASLTQFAYARNNADFPESFRTDTNRPERLSDHDIPVAFFTLIDSTAPSVNCGQADGNWHAADVTIGCTAADGGSGLNNPDDAAFDLSTSVPTDTETASAETDSRNVCDKQTNCIAAGPIGGNKVDKKKPELSASATANGANYAGGWTKYPVTVTFACQDFGSGVQSFTSPITVSSEGADQVATGTCTDNVGNMSETAFNGISIDMTAPVVSVTGVTNGGVYTLGSVPTAACSTTDALSGVAQTATVNVVGGTSNGVGTFTATCSGATDNAGNAAGPVSVSYTVQYAFSGFLPPMEQRSSFKAGSTIPMKWALLNSNGMPVTNLSAITSLQVGYNGACSGDPDGAVVEAGDAGYSGLRIAGSQFIFNWQTKGLPAGCYNLMLKLDDTSTHSVLVTLR